MNLYCLVIFELTTAFSRVAYFIDEGVTGKSLRTYDLTLRAQILAAFVPPSLKDMCKTLDLGRDPWSHLRFIVCALRSS